MNLLSVLHRLMQLPRCSLCFSSFWLWSGGDLFALILLGTCWPSWMRGFMVLCSSNLGFAIIPLNIFSAPFPPILLTLQWHVYCTHVLVSLGLCSFFFLLFSLCSSNGMISMDLSSHLLPLLIQVWCFIYPGNFSFWLLYISTPEFPLCFSCKASLPTTHPLGCLFI